MSIQITESLFKALNAAMLEAADIDLIEKQLAARKDDNRKFLLDFMTGLAVTADLINKILPGVSTQNRTIPQLDEAATLSYALHPDNFAHAAPLLSVRSDCVAVVIAAAMQDERLRSIFELNKSGAQAAARNGSHVGLPVIGIDEQTIVAVKVKDLKTGDALRAMFEVVDDPVIIVTPVAESETPADTSAELDF